MASLNTTFRFLSVTVGKFKLPPKINTGFLPAVRLSSTSNAAFKHITLIKTSKEAFFVPEKRPILLLYSWLMAKNRHVQPYADLYEERGFDVLKVETLPQHVLWPKSIGNTITEISKFLISNPSRPILVHGFSVGGFVHMEVLRHLCSLVDKDKSEEVLNRLKGQIFDSAVDIVGVGEGVSKAMFLHHPYLQKFSQALISMYLKLTHKHVRVVHQKASNIFHTNYLGVPSLMFYSKCDTIANFHQIESAIKSWENEKIFVMSKCWPNSSHVGHFKRYKDDYVDNIDKFLKIIGLTGNISPEAFGVKCSKTESVTTDGSSAQTCDEVANNCSEKTEEFVAQERKRTGYKRRLLFQNKIKGSPVVNAYFIFCKGNWERNDPGGGVNHISRSHTSTPMVAQQNNSVIIKNSWSELEITGGVSNLSLGLFDYIHLTRLSLRNNNLTNLPKQISNLTNLIILDGSGNRLQSIPAEMGKMITLKELYLNNNCLKILPFELGKLFQLQKIGIKGNPLPNKYFTFCNEVNGTQKLINFLFDHLPTSCTTVPERHWVPLETCDTAKPLVFSVLSYNVLCEKNCTRQLYPYCQSWALAWDYRRKIIIGELRRYQADILCLQEVETDQFYQFFQPELLKEGYSGIFSPKSRAKTMQENERKHVDGCAIFYKSAKFQVVSERLVEFNQIAIEAAGGSHDMINRVMTKDNIGLAVLLQTTKEAWPNGLPPDLRVNQPLLVATCHVHWDPEFCDVKIIQTMMLIKELKNIIKAAAPDLRPNSNDSKLDCTCVPMVICGDMNSVPESGVVEFLKLGQVNSNHKEFKDMSYKDCLLKLSTSTDKEIYTHNFRLKEAYLKDTLPFTNFTYDFKDIIDYIFYSYDTIRCLGVLGSPDDKWFESNNVVGCPHPQIPSDHLPLLAQLMIMPSRSFLFPSDGQQQQQQQQQQHHHHHHHFHGRP